MRVYLIIVSIFILRTFSLSGQEVKEILKNSFDKCQSIQNGYYEFTHQMKILTEMDTQNTSYQCHFRKLENDSIFSVAFNNKSFYKGEFISSVLYTGNEQVNINVKDSTARVKSTQLWSDEIIKFKHNYTFYEPFTSKDARPLSKFLKFEDTTLTYKYIGIEKVNGIDCHHIKIVEKPVYEKGKIKLMYSEYGIWISTFDSILVQYTDIIDVEINQEIMRQYRKNILTKYEINNLEDETVLTLKSVPSYFQFKDYVPYEAPPLLDINTIAPEWKLTSYDDEVISLESLRGKLVLMDFFYKNCGPCLLALPGLQALHEKYKGKIHIIGVNPYDKKHDVKEFLAKRGITYTILLGAKDVATTYNVSSYPTIYLINKDGRVIYTKVGFKEDFEKELEEVIKKNL